MVIRERSLFEVLGQPSAKMADAATRLCASPDIGKAIGTSSAALRLASDEIRGALEKQLSELDLFELGAKAWVKLEGLQKYRDREKYPPGVSTVVSLAEHTVKSEHQPELEFLLSGKPVGSFTLDVQFSAVFGGLALTIQDARIRKVATGECHVEALLSYKGTDLWKHVTRNIALPGIIDLGAGFEIPHL